MAPSRSPLDTSRSRIFRGMPTRGFVLVSRIVSKLRSRRMSTKKRSSGQSQDVSMPVYQSTFQPEVPWPGEQLAASMDKISEICGITIENSTSNDREAEYFYIGLADLDFTPPTFRGDVSKSRLKWLLSRLPLLEIPLDPVITHPVLDKFKLFESLPMELRLKIWSMLSCMPR